MKISLTLIVMLMLMLPTQAQDSMNQGRSTKRAAYRDTVCRQLAKNDIASIRVRRSLEQESEKAPFLSIDEEELLLLITQQYDALLEDILKRKSRYSTIHDQRIPEGPLPQVLEPHNDLRAPNDILGISINSYIQGRQEEIREDISRGYLQLDHKDFLLLLLDYYLVLSNFCDREQERLMLSKSKEFIKNYPYSMYLEFVKEYMDIEFERGNWGLGMYFNMGTILYSGGLESYFSTPTLIYVSWDVNYRRFDLNFGMGASIYSRITNDFFYETAWQRDHQYTFSPITAATLGYHIYDSRRLKLTPFIGVRHFGLAGNSTSDSSYYEGIDLRSQNPWTVGLTLDYKFAHGKCSDPLLNRRGGYRTNVFGDLRFKISYQNPQFDSLSDELKGGLWLATLGIGFNSYGPKRKRNKK